ncbi:hypothetical protein J2S53_000380 [Actinopolyspora lacussalsi]|nr:hypothetical protein [Actinopolyspora lacussalsi]
MTTLETGTVVTAVFHHLFRYAHTANEIDELVRTLVHDPPRQPAEVYVWDRPCHQSPDGTINEFPRHKLRVCTRPDLGWGAISYHNGTPEQQDLVDSYNPRTTEETPALLFDPEGDLWFPASASIPLEQAREAIAEYCRTGQRPESVRWQPGYWY